MTFIYCPSGSQSFWIRILSEIFYNIFTKITQGQVEDTFWTTINMYIT